MKMNTAGISGECSMDVNKAFYNDNVILYKHTITYAPTQSSFYKHGHNEYEILYFIRGNADYLIEDNIFTLNPGDLMLIKPKNYHMLMLKSSMPYERVNIAFKESIFDKAALDTLFSSSGKISLNNSSFFMH